MPLDGSAFLYNTDRLIAYAEQMPQELPEPYCKAFSPLLTVIRLHGHGQDVRMLCRSDLDIFNDSMMTDYLFAQLKSRLQLGSPYAS